MYLMLTDYFAEDGKAASGSDRDGGVASVERDQELPVPVILQFLDVCVSIK